VIVREVIALTFDYVYIPAIFSTMVLHGLEDEKSNKLKEWRSFEQTFMNLFLTLHTFVSILQS
jgi:hypothetical protein